MARKPSAKRQAKEQPAPKEEKATPSHERVVVCGLVPRMQCFNLPHEVYCAKMGQCFCHDDEVAVSVYSSVDKGQARHLLLKKKRMNSTLSIRFRQRVAVSRAALSCPEIDAAIRSAWLRVER